MQFNRYPYALLLLLACLAIATLASCVDDREGLSTPEVAVNFLPSISGSSNLAAPSRGPHGNLGGAPRSRAVNSTWAEDDAVGIYMVAHNETPVNLTALSAGNHKYLTTVAGTTTSLTPDGAAIYYPVNGDKVNFISYYPYKNTVTTTYPVDVATQNPQANIDLLYHKGATAYHRLSGSVPMLFKHQLSKMIITVIPDDGVSIDLSETTASLTGFPTTATFNLATGVLGAAGTIAELTPVKDTDATTADKAVFEAILVPHNDAADPAEYTREISLTIDGESYTYALAANSHTFASGVAYSYNFRFTGSALKLESNTILDWNEGEEIGGDYLLSLSKKEVEVPASPASTGHTLTVLTTSPNKPTLKLSDRSDAISAVQPDYWISNAVLVEDDGTPPTGWTSYTLTFDTAENKSTTDSRTGYIFVCVEGLSVPVTVNQDKSAWDAPVDTHDGLSNCYMVVPGNSVLFPATRAFTIGGAKAGNLSIKVLWDDSGVIFGTPTLSAQTQDGTISVATIADKSGNAVVALYDTSDNTIYWSWHIWVTTYLPGTATWYNNGFMFMDRNLGATEAANSLAGRGLIYQWGRKDPFPGGKTGTAGYSEILKFTFAAENKITAANTAGAGITQAIRNPLIFYTNFDYRGDWLPVYDHTLWNTSENDRKTVYDPCPDGWRVPTSDGGEHSPWYGLTGKTFSNNDAAGNNWGANALFPAAGYRYYTSGNLTTPGYYGAYWCATGDLDIPSGKTFSFRMYFFNDGDFNPQSAFIYRATGHSVRCVHESIYVTNPVPASFTGVVAGGTTDNSFTIETNSTATPTITTNDESMITGLTPTSTSLNGVYTWTVTFKVTANTDASERESTITIDIEGITKTVSVSQVAGVPTVTDQADTWVADGMSNCYIVSTNSKVGFNVSRAYTYNGSAFTTTLHIGGTYTDGFVCKTIWDDNSVLKGTIEGSDVIHNVYGGGNDAIVTVKTTGNQGNAVVGLYKEDGTTLLWSYHIWVLADYNPASATFANNGYTFMDRNLGATAAANSLAGRGLLYQWGRKDPFPGDEGTAGSSQLDKFKGVDEVGTVIEATTLNDGIVESILNPTTFYSQYSDTQHDWLPVYDNTLWNAASDRKSIYDPCPHGWRVPLRKDGTFSSGNNNSPWYGLAGQVFTAGDSGGVNWGANALYPAAGFRGEYGGAFTSAKGSNGFYWNASVHTYKTHYYPYRLALYHTGGSLSHTTYSTKLCGYSVRCVAESE